METATLWTLFGIMLALDLVFSMVRSALSNARLPYLIDQGEENPAAVERTLRLLERSRLRTSLRMWVVLSHFILGGTAGALILTVSQPGLAPGWLAGGLALAGLLILGVELALERLVQNRVETWALRLTWLGEFLDLLARPVASILASIWGQPSHRLAVQVTEDELKTWVEDGQPSGSLEQGERRMIYSIFQFSDRLVREIMIPRIDVAALDANTSIPDAIQAVTQSGHSRLPVYEETVDNILGLLYAKDLLRIRTTEAKKPSIRELLRPAYFVPEAKKVDELLREMQQRRVHIAVVVDEYGGTAGLVTLEDIVEEIVGEIRDEYDQGEELPYQQISPDEYLIQGRIDIDDLNDLLDTHLTREVADTLAGYIYGEIGRVPSGGEELEVDGWVLSVEQVSGQRIRQVRARRRLHPDEKGENDDAE